MSVFIDSDTTLVVQGITGRDGSFHAKQMIEYGTQVVAGVTPGKGGQRFEGTVPIFNTVAEAVQATGDAPGHTAHDGSSVHLLPAFDEYLLGYKDRSAVLAIEDAPKVVPGKNGVFLPTIVVGGRVVGTWKRRLKKDSIDLTLSPFTSPGDWEESALEVARSYSDFVGLPLASGAQRS